MTLNQSLPLAQGVSSGYAWPIVDLAGAPADLSGYTARCEVREREDTTSTLLATMTATVGTVVVAGVTTPAVLVTWTDPESRAWTWAFGRADVLLIDTATNGILVVWQGTFAVDKVVTSHV